MSLQALIYAVQNGVFDATNERPARFNQFMRMAEVAIPDDSRGLCGIAWKAYAGSLDAALALHEALLPDCGWGVSDLNSTCIYPLLGSPLARPGTSPARAWLLAILYVMQRKGGDA